VVVANPAPTVVVSAGTPPVGGWVAPATIPLSATLEAKGNPITKVQFLADGVVVGEYTTSPYAVSWAFVTSGTKSVVARVFYGSNQTVDSAAVSVVVANPTPTVVLGVGTPPAGGWVAPATIPLSATVEAKGNPITKVQFLADRMMVGEDVTAPYSVSWANVGSGTMTVVARVFYGSNQTVESAAVSVVVIGSVPTVEVSIGKPPAGGWVAPAIIPVEARVESNGNVVEKVQFLADGKVFGEDSTSPFGLDWVGLVGGATSISARVLYSAGRFVDAKPVTVIVMDPTPELVIQSSETGQGLHFDVVAPVGVEIVVETSIDLNGWNTSSRLVGRGGGNPVRVTVTADDAVQAKFWRVRVP